MKEIFYYSHIANQISVDLEKSSTNCSPREAFWKIYGYNALDVYADDPLDPVEYDWHDCVLLIALSSRFIHFTGESKLPLPLGEEHTQKIKIIEDPIARTEILKSIIEGDKILFLKDARRVLESLT